LIRLTSSCWLLLAGATLFAGPASQGDSSAHVSTITIHVYKSGLFSAFAHNHIVVAPIAQNDLDTQKLTAGIAVHTKDMKVTDPGDSDSTRSEIQTTMLGPKVLDAEKFPEILFKSAHIEQTSPNHFKVTGALTLHGVSNNLTFEVVWVTDHYHGSAKLKQTNFGIQPVSIGGGTVKVKDELDVEFDVYGKQSAN